MHLNGSHCGDLIEETAAALNEEAVTLMLLTVQKGNVELSVKLAWRCVHRLVTFEVVQVVRECLFAFPYIWSFDSKLYDLSDLDLYDLSDYDLSDLDLSKSFLPIMKHILSLHTIQNLIINKSSHLHVMLAVTLILKHATLLRTSKLSKAALINVELDYQRANVDESIQQYFTECAAELSVEQFAGFVMCTDIMSSQS